MVCCSANPRYATAPVPSLLSNSPHSHHIAIARPAAARNLGLVSCARVQSQFTSSLIALHRQTVRRVPIPFAAGANNERYTDDALRSEHDLNLAILYAVQSGFRYSASLFLPDLRCQPLGEIMLRVFRATRHPHSRAIPWAQANRFRPTFQVLFLFPTPDLQARPAKTRKDLARPAIPRPAIPDRQCCAS
jgi:hypothetical protein